MKKSIEQIRANETATGHDIEWDDDLYEFLKSTGLRPTQNQASLGQVISIGGCNTEKLIGYLKDFYADKSTTQLNLYTGGSSFQCKTYRLN